MAQSIEEVKHKRSANDSLDPSLDNKRQPRRDGSQAHALKMPARQRGHNVRSSVHIQRTGQGASRDAVES